MTDYGELVKALRWCMTKEDGITDCRPCHYYGKGIDCVGNLHTDAAAAIEKLQAEVKRLEPKQAKLGEWLKVKPRGVVSYSDGYAECPSCHEVIWLGWKMNFCPHCGNQNKILDPDDFEKKTEPPQEVQE